jgi:hypothetical protein
MAHFDAVDVYKVSVYNTHEFHSVLECSYLIKSAVTISLRVGLGTGVQVIKVSVASDVRFNTLTSDGETENTLVT